jgi:hypothetical protein
MEFAWKLFNNKRDVFHNEFFAKLPSKMAVLEEENIDNRLGKNIPFTLMYLWV